MLRLLLWLWSRTSAKQESEFQELESVAGGRGSSSVGLLSSECSFDGQTDSSELSEEVRRLRVQLACREKQLAQLELRLEEQSRG